MGPLRECLGGKTVCLVICGANIDAATYGSLLERGRLQLLRQGARPFAAA